MVMIMMLNRAVVLEYNPSIEKKNNKKSNNDNNNNNIENICLYIY